MLAMGPARYRACGQTPNFGRGQARDLRTADRALGGALLRPRDVAVGPYRYHTEWPQEFVFCLSVAVFCMLAV